MSAHEQRRIQHFCKGIMALSLHVTSLP